MRCPDCNKFVAYGDPEVEENGAEVSEDSVSVDVDLTLPCGECGTELKRANFGMEDTVEVKACCKGKDEHGNPIDDTKATHEWEVSEESYDPTDRYETTGKNGRPIPSRFQRHYLGVHATVTLRCTREGCDVTAEVELSDEMQASSFDELV